MLFVGWVWAKSQIAPSPAATSKSSTPSLFQSIKRGAACEPISIGAPAAVNGCGLSKVSVGVAAWREGTRMKIERIAWVNVFT